MHQKINRRTLNTAPSDIGSIKNILDVALHKCGITEGVVRCVEDSDPNDEYRAFKVESYAGSKYIVKMMTLCDESESLVELEKPFFESGGDCFFELVSDFKTPVATGFVFVHEPFEEVSDISPILLRNSSDLLAKCLKTFHNTPNSLVSPSIKDLGKDTPESVKNAFRFILDESKTKNKKPCLFISKKSDIYLSKGLDGFRFKFMDLSSASLHNPLLDIATLYVTLRLSRESLDSICSSYGDKKITSEKVLGFYDHACLLLFLKDLVEEGGDEALKKDLSKILKNTKNETIKKHYKEITNDN